MFGNPDEVSVIAKMDKDAHSYDEARRILMELVQVT
jgi:hypothetical protein